MEIDNNFVPNSGFLYAGDYSNNPLKRKPKTKFEDYTAEELSEIRSLQERAKNGGPLSSYDKRDLSEYDKIVNANRSHPIPVNNIVLACFSRKGKNYKDDYVFNSNHFIPNRYDLIIPLIKVVKEDNSVEYFEPTFLQKVQVAGDVYMPPKSKDLMDSIYDLKDYDLSFVDTVTLTEDKSKRSFSDRSYQLQGDKAFVSTDDFRTIDGLENGFIFISDLVQLTEHIQRQGQDKYNYSHPVDKKHEANLFIKNLGGEGM